MFLNALQIRTRLVALIGAVTLATLGCSTEIMPPDDALDDPDELRDAIETRLEQVDDARFHDVTMEYFGDGERVRVRQLILVERPDRLRVQTRLPGSEEILSLLVSDGDTFSLHDRDDNSYYTGAPTHHNINRMLPVDLSGQDVVRVMLGGAPWERLSRADGEPTLDWDRSRGHYRYAIEEPGGHQLAMYVRHNDFAVVELEELDADGDMVYAYATRDWSHHDGLEIPSYQRFQWPDRDLDFSLEAGRTEINVGFDSMLFSFPPPAGATIYDLDDQS